jgi:RND family efflux transporter MFP subunit
MMYHQAIHAFCQSSHLPRPYRFFPLSGKCLALCAMMSAYGCHKPEEDKKEDAAAVPVRTAIAEAKKMHPSFEVIGTVVADPERVAVLMAPIAGLVTKLAVKEGSQVKPGDLIVQLDEQKALLDRERTKAIYDKVMARSWDDELTLASSTVDKAQAVLTFAQARLDGARALRTQSPNLVPELQWKEFESNVKTAEAELHSAQAQLRLMKKETRLAQEKEAQTDWKAVELQLHWCRVTTPLAGQVVEIKARAGQRTDPGTLLATVLNTEQVLVQARVPANRLRSVVQAMHGKSAEPLAQIRSASFPELTFRAQTGWLSEQTEGTTSDVPIKLRVANDKGLLRIGMTVTAQLFGAEIEGIAIPETALSVNEEGKHVVTVVRDNKAVPTEIELTSAGEQEVRAGGWVRVLKGLTAGDAVAVENGYALPEGTPVSVLPPREKAEQP